MGQIIGNFLAPGIGAFVGFVLGALIGNLLGRKKPRTPSAWAETVLQVPYAQYGLGGTNAQNNGNLDMVTGMATTARDTLNGLIAAVAGADRLAYVTNVDGALTDQRYGHRGNGLYIKFGAGGAEQTTRLVNGAQVAFKSADEVVEYGALLAIRNTKIVGGDIFAKRAIARSPAADLTSMAGDLQIASDYGFYANNRELVNGLIKGAYGLSETDEAWYDTGDNKENKRRIDKLMVSGFDALTAAEQSWYTANKAQADRLIQALEDQSLANPWIITLQRVSELGLDKFAPSDFYGGLRGFMDSFDLAGRGLGYEAISAKSRPDGAVTLTAAPGAATDGLFSILPQALDGPVNGGLYNPRFDQNAAGWTFSSTTTSNLHGVNHSVDWAGSGNDSAWLHMGGVRGTGDYADQISEGKAAQSGVTYAVTVQAAQHRGTAQLYLLFFDANGVYIPSSGGFNSGIARDGPDAGRSGDLANYNLLTTTATAPTGAATYKVGLRLLGNGGTDPYAFFTQPEAGPLSTMQDLKNPRFTDEGVGWTTSVTGGVPHARGVNLDGWSGGGNDVMWTLMGGNPTIGASYGLRSDFLPTHAGWTYETSVLAAEHRGRAQLMVEWYNAGRGLISSQALPGTAVEGGSGSGAPASYGLLGGWASAPAGAVWRRVVLRLIADQNTNDQGVYGFFTQPISKPASGLGLSSWSTLQPADWDLQGQAVRIEGFAAATDYTIGGAATAGNNLLDYSASGATQGAGGHAGDDIMVGSAFNDILYGSDGWDWLDGGTGDDRLEGEGDRDVLIGGAGRDALYGGAGDDYLAGGDGNDQVADGVSAALWGGDGNDTIVGGAGFDSLVGEAGDDVLIIDDDGGATRDHVEGGTGSDTASFERFGAGVALNMLDARQTDGSAIIYGDQWYGVENVTGSAFNDNLWADNGANVLKGGAGDDRLEGRDGNDVLEGGAGADYLHGWGHSDIASYEGSSDGVSVNLATKGAYGGDAEGDNGFHEIEHLRGSRYADELAGDAGNNVLEGLAGDDWLVRSGGQDQFNGGDGIDTADFSVATAAITLDLSNAMGQGGQAHGSTFTSVENVVASDFNDQLRGTSGDNVFEGRKGNDFIWGYDGLDTIIFNRGDGADTVNDERIKGVTVQFGPNVKWSELSMAAQSPGGDGWFTLSIAGGGGSVKIEGNFQQTATDKNVLKLIDMNGAGALDVSDVNHAGGSWSGSTLNGGFGGSARRDMLLGGNASSTINGHLNGASEMFGNVIVGGLGNDVINTSSGDDQYAYDLGDGIDTIKDADGFDTLVLGSTIAAEDVIVSLGAWNDNNLYITFRDPASTTGAVVAGSQITVENGAIQYISGAGTRLRGIDYIQAGGAWIDLNKLGMEWRAETVGGGTNEPWCNGYDPIVFDLDGDGIDLVSVAHSNVVSRTNEYFTRVGWIGPDDGMLAIDRNGDGKITSSSELIFASTDPSKRGDLAGLLEWDTSGDGKLDAADARWGELLVWSDANQNGRSSTGELRSLTQAGIASLNLNGVATGFTTDMQFDNIVTQTTSYTRADGSSGEAFEVSLARRFLHAAGIEQVSDTIGWEQVQGDGEFGRLLNDARSVAQLATGSLSLTERAFSIDRAVEYAEVASLALTDFSDVVRPYLDPVDWLGKEQARSAATISALNQLFTTVIDVPVLPSLGLSDAGTEPQMARLAAGAPAPKLEFQRGDDAVSSIFLDADAAADVLDQPRKESLWAEGAFATASSSTGRQARWWANDLGAAEPSLGTASPGLSGRSLAALRALPAGASLPGAQQQLRQAMAGFGRDMGASPAVWSRQLDDSAARMIAARPQRLGGEPARHYDVL